MLFLIYLIAPLSNLRHSLAVLLAALGAERQIVQFDTLNAALQHTQYLSPTLILCDVTVLGNAVVDELAKMCSHWPQARLVILLDDEEQAHKLYSVGDISIVFTGIAAARLRTILNNLLREMEESD